MLWAKYPPLVVICPAVSKHQPQSPVTMTLYSVADITFKSIHAISQTSEVALVSKCC